MKQVSAFGSVTLIKNGVSVSAALTPTDVLQQTFSGDKVFPDWETAANQPTVYPYVLVTSQVGPVTDLANSAWIFAGTALTFNEETGDCTNEGLAGMFKKVTYTLGTTPVPALKITGNVMKDYTTHQKLVLNIDATVSGQTVNVTTSIDILRVDNPGDVYVGFVGATNGGVLTQNSTTTTLTAKLTRGGIEIAESQLTYQWYKENGTGWVDTGKTTKSIEVSLDDVDSQARYRVAFSINNSVVTNAYFVVSDLSDPLDIYINQPKDAMIGVGDSLQYTVVIRRVGSTDALTGFTINYALTKLDGSEIASGVAEDGKFTVTGQQVKNAGGTLNWSVTARKTEQQ